MMKSNVIFFSLLFVISCLYGCKEMKYNSGRDTIESFGNGRFQIIRVDGERKTLYDLEKQRTIVYKAVNWKKSKDYVYILEGRNSTFVVLNLENGNVQRFHNTQEMSDDLNKVYHSLL